MLARIMLTPELSLMVFPSMNLDEVKMVPRRLRKAVTLWVTEKVCGALKMRDAKYRAVQNDAAIRLDEYGLQGAWHEAKMRIGEAGYKSKLRM